MTADLTHEGARRLVLRTWVEGLETGEKALLHAHLDGCVDCAAYADRIEDRLTALRGEDLTVDPGLLERTRDRLRAQVAERARLQTTGWFPVGVSLLACAPVVSWAFVADRLVAWSSAPLGIGPAAAPVLTSLLWFLPSTVTATAILLLAATQAPAGLHRPGAVSITRQVQ